MIQVDPSTVLGSGEIAVNIIRFLITLAAGAVITRVAVMPMTERLVRKKADTKTSHSIVNFAGLTGLFVSFTVALQAGSFGNLASIIGAIAAALTVAVGFGMRDQISNVMAGVLMYFDPPFVRGDYIEVNEKSGVVKQTNLRDTVIKNDKSQKVVLPNAMITGNPTLNYTRADRTKRNLTVDLEPDKLEEVQELLKEVAGENEEVRDKPVPEVRIDSEGPKATLYYWIDRSSRSEKIKSDLTEQYLSQASERGLTGKKDE
ncbi:mechanosensitive ion channel [Candidatus Nanohaloarchaea archaeon]|nr:mechanosensitive ion channel [Candidatus Nanohaloarchaea archaeon]